MALVLHSERIELLARELAALTGEHIEQAIIAALNERIDRWRAPKGLADQTASPAKSALLGSALGAAGGGGDLDLVPFGTWLDRIE